MRSAVPVAFTLRLVKIAVLLLLMLLVLVGAELRAQSQTQYPPPERQIAAAVSPLPATLRAGARVLGYDPAGQLRTLRYGDNGMVCLADNPAGKMFHVACYHRSLEPFMARGRALTAQGKSPEQIDSIRLADIRAGRYRMPSRPTALYQYFAARDSVDTATGTIRGASYLYVVYTPYATEQTSGLSAQPLAGGPWIMYPGKPWAHIMIAPEPKATITP